MNNSEYSSINIMDIISHIGKSHDRPVKFVIYGGESGSVCVEDYENGEVYLSAKNMFRFAQLFKEKYGEV